MWKQPHAQIKNLGCEQLDLSPGDTLGRVRGITRCGKNMSDRARGRRDFQNKTESDLTQKKGSFLTDGNWQDTRNWIIECLFRHYSSPDVHATDEQCLDKKTEQQQQQKTKQIECSFIMQTKNKVGGLSMWMWSKVMQRLVELQQRHSLFVLCIPRRWILAFPCLCVSCTRFMKSKG